MPVRVPACLPASLYSQYCVLCESICVCMPASEPACQQASTHSTVFYARVCVYVCLPVSQPASKPLLTVLCSMREYVCMYACQQASTHSTVRATDLHLHLGIFARNLLYVVCLVGMSVCVYIYIYA